MMDHNLIALSTWLGLTAPLASILLVLTLALIGCMVRLRQTNKAQRQQLSLIQQLQENTDSFRYLVETAHEGIAVVQNHRLVYLNPRLCEMSGYTEEELKALPSFIPLVDPSVRDIMLANYQRRLAGEPTPQRYESLFVRKDGTSYPIELSGVAIVWRGEAATLNMLTDISERKAAEEKMHYLAHHDSLTGLPNRAALQERLQHAITLAQRNQQPLAVLFIDLNGFKQINDTFGHEVGDALLQQVAHRIQPLFRESDTFARMGGDEFILLLTQVTDAQSISQSMQRIEEAMAAPFIIQGQHLHCYVSQGAALYPEDGETVQVLLSHADHNMYASKRHYYQKQGSA
ncbi:sensor domain-containing diguanylate cyclase [Oceanisphaera avium]|uniref:Diguanylate cyclase n=1 Tax=Oceanisphaera avium TaxID=1903694 RepID=A0A1Y0CW16_9GAMM|nr:sensor domain-containing diguanylate cyclase [Oceanisphaera avium]ART79533.1 hypothetical protein CBP12_04695 [Oceanisphaera avium]